VLGGGHSGSRRRPAMGRPRFAAARVRCVVRRRAPRQAAGRAPPSPQTCLVLVTAPHGSAGASAPEPCARAATLIPDLESWGGARRPRSAQAQGTSGPHRGDSLGPAARRRKRGEATGGHHAVLPALSHFHLTRGERFFVATTCGHVETLAGGGHLESVQVGARAQLPWGLEYVCQHPGVWQLEVLKSASERNEWRCESAAPGGQLEVPRWAQVWD